MRDPDRCPSVTLTSSRRFSDLRATLDTLYYAPQMPGICILAVSLGCPGDGMSCGATAGGRLVHSIGPMFSEIPPH